MGRNICVVAYSSSMKRARSTSIMATGFPSGPVVCEAHKTESDQEAVRSGVRDYMCAIIALPPQQETDDAHTNKRQDNGHTRPITTLTHHSGWVGHRRVQIPEKGPAHRWRGGAEISGARYEE